MSQDDLTPDRTAAPTGAPSDTARPSRPQAPPRSSGGTLALALLLALIAIVGVGYVAWRQVKLVRVSTVALHTTTGLEQRVNNMDHALTGTASQSATLLQRLNDADQINRSLREELLSQDQRMRDLEEAVGRLSEKTLSGQDAMRLDETESLLRMGSERYMLFHDAQSAAQAYALAGQSLAAVNDNAFDGVRQSIEAEHEALLKSQSGNREQLLDSIVQLRDGLAALPLKPLDEPAPSTNNGVWARIVRAFSGVVKISRDNGAPIDIADARIARELVALDLAQAQTALIAWDNDACLAALKRADAGLAGQFDAQAPAVRQARDQLALIGNQLKPAIPVQLGGALSELRNLRAVHALKSEPDDTAAPGEKKP
ncbi:MAG TPA: uroporphyrinogen-III C-methyltransferase [Dyella sp.]|uniref:uroporphyrinogen-III C-methyltransferase n=1 Tax=Dyella sp. TaxID=1869338 RepID=UPI002B98D8B9|nr:uroporphyrinogen-III C-methyltransferase [Dyella sp.]HTV85145.1 uroporphyrinogen-III C-methyltransferase [Dyella sp.]